MSTMTIKAARGTKRTCQNPQCGSRFYDLNRDPIVCPICQTTYEIATSPGGAAEERGRRSKKPEFVPVVPVAEGVPEVEGAEELVDIEAVEEPIAAEADETFLEEEEEDGGDVSGILGGAVEGDEEV